MTTTLANFMLDPQKYGSSPPDPKKYGSSPLDKQKYESGNLDQQKYGSSPPDKEKCESSPPDKQKYESSPPDKQKYGSSPPIMDSFIKPNVLSDTESSSQEGSPRAAMDPSGLGSPGKPSVKPFPCAAKPGVCTRILPLCKVCEAQATGFHYGVNTCEACKGFFHRSIGRTKQYRCFQNSRCEIRQGVRSLCPRCRYEKCLAVGMSKEGIKTGRYTYEKRTQDILEVNRQRVEAVNAAEDQLIEKQEEYLDEFITSMVKAKERLLSELQVIATDASSITAVHHDAPAHELRLPRFSPDMEPNAGMSAIWRKWVSVIENTGGLQRLIKFVKTIPGFRDLDMADQIQLIKHSFCELWVVSKHYKFDVLRKCYTNNFGFTFDLVKALGQDYADQVLAVADRLQMMELSPEETCVLLTFVIFARDRVQLLEPDKVERIAEHVLAALQYILRKNHPHDRLRFPRITHILTELRSITDHYHRHNVYILSDVGQISPLLWEIFNLS